MQICKKCACEFDDALRRCPQCGGKPRFRAEEYYQGALDLRCAASVYSENQLELYCSVLEGAGIHTLVQREGAGGVVGAILGRINFMRADIYVLAEQLDDAQQVLAAFQQPAPDGGDAL